MGIEAKPYRDSCHKHKQSFVIDHVTRSLYYSKYECPFCKLEGNQLLTWIPVSERKPSDGKPVLIHCISQLRKPIVLRATWYPRFTEECGEDEFEAGEYCEEKDEYFVREGWYEHNQYEEVHWNVSETVTHWAGIPLPPVE